MPVKNHRDGGFIPVNLRIFDDRVDLLQVQFAVMVAIRFGKYICKQLAESRVLLLLIYLGLGFRFGLTNPSAYAEDQRKKQNQKSSHDEIMRNAGLRRQAITRLTTGSARSTRRARTRARCSCPRRNQRLIHRTGPMNKTLVS